MSMKFPLTSMGVLAPGSALHEGNFFPAHMSIVLHLRGFIGHAFILFNFISCSIVGKVYSHSKYPCNVQEYDSCVTQNIEKISSKIDEMFYEILTKHTHLPPIKLVTLIFSVSCNILVQHIYGMILLDNFQQPFLYLLLK